MREVFGRFFDKNSTVNSTSSTDENIKKVKDNGA